MASITNYNKTYNIIPFEIVTTADISTNATVNIPIPYSIPADLFVGGMHRIKIDEKLYIDDELKIAYDKNKIILTNTLQYTINAGTKIIVYGDAIRQQEYRNPDGSKALNPLNVQQKYTFILNLRPNAKDEEIINEQIINSLSTDNTNIDTARTLSVVSDNATDTKTLRIIGQNFAGYEISEDITVTGTTAVETKKAFLSIQRVEYGTVTTCCDISKETSVGKIAIKTANKFPLSHRIYNTDQVVKITEDGTDITSPTTKVSLGNTDAESTVSSDQTGLYSPTATPDGIKPLIIEYTTVNPYDCGKHQITSKVGY